MEWPLVLLLIFGCLMVLMLTGLPVAFCFMLVNLVGVFILWGGETGLLYLTKSLFSSVATFVLLPVPLFVLMGEVMFHSGMAIDVMDALDKWLGRLRGRLALLAVASGTVFATFSGVSFASVAMLGSILVPEMEKRGYKKSMSLGPILGSGGLAAMIPPSALAVLLGAVGDISIGKLLIAIIIPGLLMAVLYATYIILRCRLQPSIAPTYQVTSVPLADKIIAFVKYVVPLGGIIFLLIGVILLGIASPSEAAAWGALGCFILLAAHRRLNWQVVKKSVVGTLKITVMALMIVAGSSAFGQILAFSGASRALTQLIVGLPLSPLMIILVMQVVLLFLGMFLNVFVIMLITLPIFMPTILSLGLDPVWYGVIFLINLEMAGITPPFGLSLFVMKGVAPPDTTMADIIRAGLPFVCCSVMAMMLVIAFPLLALWLPGMIR